MEMGRNPNRLSGRGNRSIADIYFSFLSWPGSGRGGGGGSGGGSTDMARDGEVGAANASCAGGPIRGSS